jgi:hypothetical protein
MIAPQKIVIFGHYNTPFSRLQRKKTEYFGEKASQFLALHNILWSHGIFTTSFCFLTFL